jgi:argininosuccinate lyase
LRKKKRMDIRGPRLRKPSERALQFTSSMAADGRIARHVIAVNTAHMLALVSSGEVPRREGARCVGFLLASSPRVDPEAKYEDFHQQLEQDAVDALGVEAAGFLNFGKSRNDQVATAIRMELRARIIDLLGAIARLQGALLRAAKGQGKTLVPAYTHLQRAQPVTLAHYLFAYFDAFQRDAERLFQLYSRVNLSPMGSAALAGTSTKVDRALVAGYLGFAGVVPNSIDAVSSRDLSVEAIVCATTSMLDASRLAEEQILWSSREFGFAELDDAYAASSSIMPQKKNAVSSELVRAKAGSVLGSLVAVCAILKALPYTYNLDLQETTPHLWRAMDDAVASVEVLAGSLATTKFKPAVIRESMSGDYSTAVALANHLVEEGGISFRQAHSIVGELVRVSLRRGVTLEAAAAADLGRVSAKFGKKLIITEDEAGRVLDPERFLESISTPGGANPAFIPADLGARQKALLSNRAELSQLGSPLRASERRLLRSASGLAREVKTKT